MEPETDWRTEKVPGIYWGSAEEVSRVVRSSVPQVVIVPIHATSEVRRMISRAESVDENRKA